MAIKYIYPGVYLEELPSGAHPIPGLPGPVPIDRILAYETSGVLRALAAQVRKDGPGPRLLLTGAKRWPRICAARTLARRLHVAFYRVDLAAVASKYIGETEKHLGRLFDATRDGHAILLFDEADALFGKRSEVKEAHDRYANMERNYFLQRMEDFRGLAILAINQRANIDRVLLQRQRNREEEMTANRRNKR